MTIQENIYMIVANTAISKLYPKKSFLNENCDPIYDGRTKIAAAMAYAMIMTTILTSGLKNIAPGILKLPAIKGNETAIKKTPPQILYTNSTLPNHYCEYSNATNQGSQNI